MLRFSNKAYYSMKCICFDIKPSEIDDTSFFATSIIDFDDWFTAPSFLYFLLVIHRCSTKKMHRVFLSNRSEQEFTSEEKDSFNDILEVHRISNFPCYLLTYEKLNKFFDCNSNGILVPSDVNTFQKKKDNKELDFGIVELVGGIKILLIPRFPPPGGTQVEVEFYVENEVSKNYFERKAKSRLSEFFNPVIFEENPDKFQYYDRFKRLLLSAINNNSISPLFGIR